MRLRTTLTLCAALLPLGACSDQPTAPADVGAFQVRLAALAAGPYGCGQAIPVSASVTNDRGKPVGGLLLNFNVLAGGGSIYGGAALTDSKGTAADIWTLGHADVPNTMAIRAVASSGVATEYATMSFMPFSRIAFASSGEIYVMNSDGSGPTNVTNNVAYDESPSWSPDGSKIAFTRQVSGGNQIWVMNADGTGQVNVSNNGANDIDPAWSPDGRKIAFARMVSGGTYEIYVMNADGSGATNLSNTNTTNNLQPAWSPDRRKIAFVRYGLDDEIYVMNADGSGLVNLTNNSAHDVFPAWSPDGTRIAFTSLRDGNGEIYVMNADGSGLINLTNDSAPDVFPAWSADGSKIAFESLREIGGVMSWGIFTISANGTELTRLSTSSYQQEHLNWTACGGH